MMKNARKTMDKSSTLNKEICLSSSGLQSFTTGSLRIDEIHTRNGNWILRDIFHKNGAKIARKSLQQNALETGADCIKTITNSHIVTVKAAANPTSIAADMSFWQANKIASIRSEMPGAHDRMETAANAFDIWNCRRASGIESAT